MCVPCARATPGRWTARPNTACPCCRLARLRTSPSPSTTRRQKARRCSRWPRSRSSPACHRRSRSRWLSTSPTPRRMPSTSSTRCSRRCRSPASWLARRRTDVASQVDVGNLALGQLAQDRGIAAMSDASKEARTASRVWDIIRDEVLEARNWPFAMTAQALAVVAEDPQQRWCYRYALPNDCLTLRTVTDESGLRGARGLGAFFDHQWCAGVYDYETAYGQQGTSILTDAPEAYAVFVARVTDTGRYSAHFIDALACRLAAELAPTIIGEAGLRVKQTMMERDYIAALSQAHEHAANQSRARLEALTPALAARG